MTANEEALNSALPLDEQAALYFVTSLGDVDPAQRRVIDQWLSSDPRHAVALARIRSAWHLAEGLRKP